jgi:hypothetical protein
MVELAVSGLPPSGRNRRITNMRNRLLANVRDTSGAREQRLSLATLGLADSVKSKAVSAFGLSLFSGLAAAVIARHGQVDLGGGRQDASHGFIRFSVGLRDGGRMVRRGRRS